MTAPVGRRLLVAVLLLVVLSATPSTALIRYIAFGDSISAGIGDPELKGYPSRLRRILEKNQGDDIQVVKSAVPGEETSAAVSRIDEALNKGGDALLLMEGTNDVSRMIDGVLSMETTIANLDAMALAAKRRGIEPIHATIIPRSPRDRDSKVTRNLAQEIRALAGAKKRRLVDVFEAYDPEVVEDVFDLYFFSGFDPVGHPNEEGYKRIEKN